MTLPTYQSSTIKGVSFPVRSFRWSPSESTHYSSCIPSYSCYCECEYVACYCWMSDVLCDARMEDPERSHMVLSGFRAFLPTSADYVGPPRDFGPSCIRSGSAAPSRVHSLSNAYVWPPLHCATLRQRSSPPPTIRFLSSNPFICETGETLHGPQQGEVSV
jgi:hypothetical protein